MPYPACKTLAELVRLRNWPTQYRDSRSEEDEEGGAKRKPRHCQIYLLLARRKGGKIQVETTSSGGTGKLQG